MVITVSSKKAAEMLKVNESTVKRWADSGILECSKTPGGHRKFNVESINNLASEYKINNANILSDNISSKTRFQIISKDFKALNKVFEKDILKGDLKSTYNFLYSLVLNNYSNTEIFDLIVKETMGSIGDKWEKKQLDISSEHIASNTLLASLIQLNNVIKKNDMNGKTAICAGLETELHEIGLICVRVTLESLGWNVVYPGINLPLKSLSELVKATKPDLVCITAAYHLDTGNSINQLKKILAGINKKSGIKLIVGGSAAKGINEEFHCNSISDLMTKIKDI